MPGTAHALVDPKLPANPLELGGASWKNVLARTKRRIVRDRVAMAAGSLAYHWFLALFPAVIAALGVLSLVQIGRSTIHTLTDGLARALPPGSAGVFESAVSTATRRSAASFSAVVIGVVVALWSASSGMAVLEQALDIAYEVPKDRKYAARRLRAFPLMAVTAAFGGPAAALIVFGAPIGSAISSTLSISSTAFGVVWTLVRWVLAFAIITLLFSTVYFLGANREQPRWQWVSPGGMLASATFLLASLGFSFYVSSFGSYDKTYGSFAGVAILIFWLWLVGLAVLVGGELNAEVERAAARRSATGASPTGVSPSGAQAPATRAAS